MIDQLMLPAMIITAVSGGAVVLAHAVGAFLYDVRVARCLRQARNHPHAHVYRQRALVTVLVSAHNDAQIIDRCLESIFKNNYRKFEVLVVDHASQDATKQIVKRAIAAHPNRRVRLVARRTEQGKTAAIRQAFKRHGHGRLLMVLPATSYLDKTALARATKHFATAPDLDILSPNEQIIPVPTVGGLLENYHSLLFKRTNKFLSLAGMASARTNASCYRADAFLRLYARLGSRHSSETAPPKVRYAHDVIVNTPSQSSFAALLARNYVRRVQDLRVGAGQLGRHRSFAAVFKLRPWLRAGYALCSAIISVTGPLLLAYFLYLALGLHEPTLLLLNIAGLSAFLLFSIGEAEQLKPRQKAAYAFGIPMTYGLFYLWGVSRLLATVSFGVPSRAAAFRPR